MGNSSSVSKSNESMRLSSSPDDMPGLVSGVRSLPISSTSSPSQPSGHSGSTRRGTSPGGHNTINDSMQIDDDVVFVSTDTSANSNSRNGLDVIRDIVKHIENLEKQRDYLLHARDILSAEVMEQRSSIAQKLQDVCENMKKETELCTSHLSSKYKREFADCIEENKLGLENDVSLFVNIIVKERTVMALEDEASLAVEDLEANWQRMLEGRKEEYDTALRNSIKISQEEHERIRLEYISLLDSEYDELKKVRVVTCSTRHVN